jgi:superfamily II DNA or RNA helicase
MFFNLADLRRAFDAPTLERGRSYFDHQHVLNVRFDTANDVVSAQVRGSSPRPYAVTLSVRGDDGARTVGGWCSCPVGGNCKHAAALAFAVAEGFTGDGLQGAPDGAVDAWVEGITERYAKLALPRNAEHLRYAIDIGETHGLRRFRVTAHIVPILKSGLPGAARAYGLHNLATGNAKFTTPLDRTVGRLLNASGLLGMGYELSPTILGLLLELLVSEGRLHWQSIAHPPLQRVELDDARIAWSVADDGLRRPHLTHLPSSVLLPTAPLWYVDPSASTAGPARVDTPPEIAALLAQAPALEPAQAERAQVALHRVFQSTGVEGPASDLALNIEARDPQPVLRLTTFGSGQAAAELLFAYGERIVTPNDPEQYLRFSNGAAVSVWPRNTFIEARAQELLRDLGFASPPWAVARNISSDRVVMTFLYASDERWLRFLDRDAPRLRSEGWRIEVAPLFPYRIVEAGDEWSAEVYESGSPQWFELELGIEVEGARISLLPVLIDALARNGIELDTDPAVLARRETPFLGKLPNGTYVALPPERVARVLSTLGGLFGERAAVSRERVTVPLLQAAALSDLDGLTTRWDHAPSVRAMLDDLAGFAKRRITLPAAFKGELRPYQRDGVAWLQTLRAHNAGGILADDMGLGKTVELLAHVAIERASKRLQHPVLVVAPTSVVPNWRAEIARFLPSARVVSLTGPDRFARFAEVPQAQIALTTYALLPRDIERLAEHQWSIVVLDEAQAIKNPRAKAATAVARLQAKQRIALSGTPIENHLEELWSIFAFALPGLLPERARFSRLFRTPIEKHGDASRRAVLAARIRPFLLRRTKERVAQELPEKTEIVQRIELSGPQRDLYETIRLTMHKRVRDEIARRGLARSRIVVLDALLKLRQVCCDPRLLKLPAAAGVKESYKLDALLEMLESLIEDGRRILLFSQFTSMLDLIKPELTKRSLAFVELRGDTRDRETPVTRFQNREVPLFLISLKAGGTGLNLTAADTVIHYDPWWNPAVERQATDRAHRLGQEQHVFIYKLIAEHTVEERILELQERKGALAASLFDDAADTKLDLEPEDLDRLFS